MKILIVIDDYFTTNNGTSVSGQRFVEELRRRGHNVRILTYVADSMPTDENIYRLPELHIPIFEGLIHSYGFCLAKPVESIIREAVKWADIVHTMMPFVIEYKTKEIADSMGKPTTSAFHIQPENITSAINLGKVKSVTDFTYWLFRRYTYDNYTHVHTPSYFMEKTLREHHYQSDIRAISNGIADDFVYHKCPKTPELESKIVITMVGRLAREKRQDVIIQAVKHSKYADKIQLIFAGKGPLQAQYEQLGRTLPHRPIFGYYSKAELLDILGMTDLYVHASDMESEAISCIEAFATGLVPIIANSNLSATPQFALDHRSLFKPGDPQHLAAKIDYWIEHPDKRQEMEHKYAQYADKYRLSSSVEQFEQMLYDAVKKRRAI